MYVKKIFAVVLAVMMLATAAFAECGCGNGLSGNAAVVFDSVKWCASAPKNAQVVSAMEYMCKIEDQQLRLILIEITQDENIEMMFGYSSKIMIVDMDTGIVYGYKDISYPESSEVATREDALRCVYGGFDSYVQGINEFVWADHEMSFMLSEDDIAAVNVALTAHFVK